MLQKQGKLYESLNGKKVADVLAVRISWSKELKTRCNKTDFANLKDFRVTLATGEK